MLQYSGNTMLAVTNNTPRALALKSASEKYALIHIKAQTDRQQLRDELDYIYNEGNGRVFTFADGQNYKLEILDARSGFDEIDNVVDDTGTPTMIEDDATTIALWNNPLTLGVKVSFRDKQGTWLSAYTPVAIQLN